MRSYPLLHTQPHLRFLGSQSPPMGHANSGGPDIQKVPPNRLPQKPIFIDKNPSLSRSVVFKSGRIAYFRLSCAMKARPAGPGGASLRKTAIIGMATARGTPRREFS